MVQRSAVVGDDRDGYLWSAEKREGVRCPYAGTNETANLLFGTCLFRA